MKKHVKSELFLCVFFHLLWFGPLAGASVQFRHFLTLLHLNKHELHEFIILLRESSFFWYFFMYALRTDSHHWIHFFPLDLFPFNGMQGLYEASLSRLHLICLVFLVSTSLLFIFFFNTACVFHENIVSPQPISEILGLILSPFGRR